MGNPSTNSLPRCQLSSIQNMVDSLSSQQWEPQNRHRSIFGPRKAPREGQSWKMPMEFWIDTLCVPVQNEEARNLAIENMRNVYEDADGVLVLDSWVQEVERSESLAERAARLILCTWARRYGRCRKLQWRRICSFNSKTAQTRYSI
jgi:hypothetical protein